MPRHNHLAHCSCSADHNQLQRATVSPTAADGPWPLLTLSYELCRPCAVSPWLQALQTTRRRLVHLLVPEVPPSTACTPGQRWTIPAGPYAWSATKIDPALCALLDCSPLWRALT